MFEINNPSINADCKNLNSPKLLQTLSIVKFLRYRRTFWTVIKLLSKFSNYWSTSPDNI